LLPHPFCRANIRLPTRTLDRVWELVEAATGRFLNVVRQIMGHSSLGEFLETYRRSWPLLFSLNSCIVSV